MAASISRSNSGLLGVRMQLYAWQDLEIGEGQATKSERRMVSLARAIDAHDSPEHRHPQHTHMGTKRDTMNTLSPGAADDHLEIVCNQPQSIGVNHHPKENKPWQWLNKTDAMIQPQSTELTAYH
jgi:hypothetical protein